MAGGSFYQAYQLAGPYVLRLPDFPILYPPIVLPMLVVSSWLPGFLWWAIPILATAAVVWYWRPTLLGWTLILACIAVPHTLDIYGNGNPGMWAVAFLGLGTIWGWPAVLVALKPSLAPFMLVGITRRTWWIAAGALAIASVAFAPLWADYVTTLRNARGPDASLLYSFRDIPSMLVPIIAWRLNKHQPIGQITGSGHRA